MNASPLSFAPAWHAAGYASAATPRRADPATLQQIGGQTMGTTWSLRFDNPRMVPLEGVRSAVEAALSRVIRQMSHWEADSDLSRYNGAAAGSVHALAPEFAKVMACALHWADASDGALDPTVAPLVSLWGFGPRGDANARAPSPERLRAARGACGWRRLGFNAADATLQQPGGLTLDLSGIAKGFAVDHVVEALRALALENLLVEIGGELRGEGHRPDGRPWTVQVDGLSQTVELEGLAVATSGDRWHWREQEGRRWSHTIDPRTGKPVEHRLASVTVLHRECMQADALATALTVLGPEDGLAFADAQGIAALFLARETDVAVARASRAWAGHTHA